MDLVCVTVDCAEPEAVAHFWSAALGWEGPVVDPDGTIAVTAPADGGLYLEFVRVPEAKVVKNRLHLGCRAGTLDDLDAEVERLLVLGASLAWEEDLPAEVAATYRNVVLRDVEGNELCLSGGTIPGLTCPPSGPRSA